MVSLQCVEGETLLSKQRNGQSSLSPVLITGIISGIDVPVFRFYNPSLNYEGCHQRFPFPANEEQSLLDSLLLAKWEDLSWKNIIKYDVTSCPKHVVNGAKGFCVQLNENLKTKNGFAGSNHLSTSFELSIIPTFGESIILCFQMGDVKSTVLASLSDIPKGSILAIANATPVEYGHIFLVPYQFYYPACHVRYIEHVLFVASELRNCSFKIAYDHHAISKASHTYFQACYFIDHLAVEHAPIYSLFNSPGEGVCICEIIGYPIKALVFSSMNLNSLAIVVSEIFSFLTDQNTLFSLLISGCGKKIFLFLQNSETENHLSAWECGGHFVFTTSEEFDKVSEEDILQKMATASLDDGTFQVVKQISCSIAHKLCTRGQCF